MRTPAQVAPHPFLGARVQVVVDGQFTGADLHDLGSVDRVGTLLGLEVHQFELERLVGQLLLRRLHRLDDATGDLLRPLDDLLHTLLQRLQILRSEGAVDGEVVVEAVLDRRSDTQLGFGELLLDGLGEHVRGGVTDHTAPVLAVGRHRLHLDVDVRHPREVTQGPLGITDDDDRLSALARITRLTHRGTAVVPARTNTRGADEAAADDDCDTGNSLGTWTDCRTRC